MTSEIWKGVKGHASTHQASNRGRVRSIKKTETGWAVGRMLTPRVDSGGYHIVDLVKRGNKKTVYVHRLVAIAHIPNPKNLPEVNHIDGNKSHNNVENLEWMSKSDNIKHAFATGLIKRNKGIKHGRSKLSNHDVLEIRDLYKNDKKKWTHRRLASKFKVSSNAIFNIVNNKTWTHI